MYIFKKITTILFIAIFGLTTIIYSLLDKKDNISTFNSKQTEITIIDLSVNNDINYLLFIGLFLFISSFILFFIKYFTKFYTYVDDNTNLTQKENEILTLIEKGYSNKDISNELYISVSTVKTHITNIFKKKKVTKRDHLRQKS